MSLRLEVAVSNRHSKARQRAPCDTSSTLLWQRERIQCLTLVLFGPDMSLRLRLNELRGDANAAADSPQARLEEVRDAQLPGDLVSSFRRIPVVHRRRPRDDAKSRGIRSAQMGDHLLGQAVAEVLLVGISRQV